jgi:hypothetical protein
MGNSKMIIDIIGMISTTIPFDELHLICYNTKYERLKLTYIGKIVTEYIHNNNNK